MGCYDGAICMFFSGKIPPTINWPIFILKKKDPSGKPWCGGRQARHLPRRSGQDVHNAASDKHSNEPTSRLAECPQICPPTWRSRWKLGSMVNEWVITYLYSGITLGLEHLTTHLLTFY